MPRGFNVPTGFFLAKEERSHERTYLMELVVANTIVLTIEGSFWEGSVEKLAAEAKLKCKFTTAEEARRPHLRSADIAHLSECMADIECWARQYGSQMEVSAAHLLSGILERALTQDVDELLCLGEVCHEHALSSLRHSL